MNKTIARNYFYTIAYKILSILAPIVTTPYVSQILHSDGVGIYSYTYSIATAFALFAALGINTYGQREIAYRQNDKENKIKAFDEIFQMRLITTFLVSIIYFVFCSLYIEYGTALLLQSAVVISAMFDISWYFYGMENFKIVVIRNIIIKIATIGLIFIFVKTSDDVSKYILLNSLSVLISNIVFFISLDVPPFKYKLKIDALKNHLVGALTFFVPLIATEIYSHLDKIMLGSLAGNDFENGYYEQARKVTQLVLTIVTSINVVMMPRISNLYSQNDKERIKIYFQKSVNIIYLLMLPCIVGLFIVSDQFVLWFMGEDFAKVSLLLKICCIMIPFMGLGNFIGMQFLSPTNQQNKMTKAYITAAVANTVLNIILIPKFASVGALTASLIAEIISCSLQIYYLLKSEYKFNMLKDCWKYIISVSFMAICLVLFNSAIPLTGIKHTFINIIIAVAVYVLALIAVKDEFVFSIINKVKK